MAHKLTTALTSAQKCLLETKKSKKQKSHQHAAGGGHEPVKLYISEQGVQQQYGELAQEARAAAAAAAVCVSACGNRLSRQQLP
eukprot:1159589-Pelagomonas_calceolata.AAC.1